MIKQKRQHKPFIFSIDPFAIFQWKYEYELKRMMANALWKRDFMHFVKYVSHVAIFPLFVFLLPHNTPFNFWIPYDIGSHHSIMYDIQSVFEDILQPYRKGLALCKDLVYSHWEVLQTQALHLYI